MSDFLNKLDKCFGNDEQILNEVSTMPAGELNRILNQSDIKRSIASSDKGAISDAWDVFFNASRRKNKEQVKKSFARLVMGYGIILMFLGQPRNKRMQFLKNFLKSTQGAPSKK
jgi:hypothetical protein